MSNVDTMAERAVLGALLHDDSLIGELWGKLDPEDFAEPGHVQVYKAALDMLGNGSAFDLVTLVSYLESNGVLSIVGGNLYLASLADELPDPANISHYAAIVRRLALRRRLARLGELVAERARDAEEDAATVIDEAAAELGRLAAPGEEIGASDAHDLVADIVDDARRDPATRPQSPAIYTGIWGIDNDLGGLRAGQVLAVAARTGVGKTAMAMQIGVNAALDGRSVLVATLEMSRAEMGWRMVTQQTGISVYAMRSHALEPPDIDKVATVRDRLRGANLVIVDRGISTPPALRARCRAQQLKRGLDLVVVDYVQLMRAGERTSGRTEEVTAITRAIKIMAKDLGVSVIECSQLSREADRRAGEDVGKGKRGHEPRLSDLRESGSIEQDSDAVLLLDRRTEGTPDEIERCTAILAKNRSGPTGRYSVTFDPIRVRFEGNV